MAKTTTFVKNDFNNFIALDIPDVEGMTATLHIQGSFNVAGGYTIDRLEHVTVRRNSVIMFIQTDKPVYKPGQTVRFRILPLDSQLIPLTGVVVGNVWIEDPSGIMVAQWQQLDLSDGIVQLENPLSEEPVIGTWRIHAKVRNVTESQTFAVMEYVLPKFEVVIIPPSYILVDATEVPVKVCAKYTYGKDVDGLMNANITYFPSSFSLGRKKSFSVEHKEKISGCVEFDVKTETLLKSNSQFRIGSLEISVNVLEDNTGIERNVTTVVEITNAPLKIKFVGGDENSHYFKPGLPYRGMLQVSKPDSTAAVARLFEVCAEAMRNFNRQVERTFCKTFASDKNGLINFTIPSLESSIEKVRLTAKLSDEEEELHGSPEFEKPNAAISLQAWYSASKSYIQIEPIARNIQCDHLERVKVLYTNHHDTDIEFYHEVIARGRIVQLGSHRRSSYDGESHAAPEDKDDVLVQKHSSDHGAFRRFGSHETDVKDQSKFGEFMLGFDARAALSPVVNLLVFYVREDGEVVADSRKFRIKPCLRNKVQLAFSPTQQYPDTEAAMLISASPLSLCGVTMVDKSVHLMSSEQKLNKKEIFKLMESFDVRKNTYTRYPHQFCNRPHFGYSDISDLRRRRRRIFYENNFVTTENAFEESGVLLISDFSWKRPPCPSFPDYNPNHPVYLRRYRGPVTQGANVPLTLAARVDDDDEDDVRSVHRVPEMDGRRSRKQSRKKKHQKVAMPKATLEVRNYFPETWLWELHKLEESGLAAMTRKLPHTITEWMGTAICIHSSQGLGISDEAKIVSYQPFFASFSLPYSVIRGEVVSVVVSVFNYLNTCLAIKLSLEASDSFKALDPSGNSKLCVCGSKSASHKFLIRPLVVGTMNITVYAYSLEDDDTCGNEIVARLTARDAVTKQLIVEAEGFPREETFNTYFCPKNSNGSHTEEFDLLLPEDVVDGSARAYASVTGDLMGPALSGIEGLVRLPVGCGEQNMVLFTPNIYILDYLTITQRLNEEIKTKALDYMRKGYQRELRYRHEDGSYSAFGSNDKEGSMWLTAFVVRSFTAARRFITIDEKDLQLSTKWIVKKQLENGCFPSVGDLIHKALQGGLEDDDGSLAPLSAYIIISLLESDLKFMETAQAALPCLKSSVNPSTYSLALFAYAAALAESPLAADYLKQLEDRATSNGQVTHWSESNRAINVEIAGYVVLTMLRMDGVTSVPKALPIIRWIAQQRNSNGGFVSTQDTVVALQALAKYASYGAGGEVNIGIALEGDEFVHGFKIDESNKLLVQTAKIRVLPTAVDLQASGEGCALAQLSLRYNVRNPVGSEAFDLSVTATRQGSFGCNSPSIGICMRYKVPGALSNMAVVNVKMMSGYIPDEWSLHRLKDEEELALKRHEVSGNAINFYFMKLSNERKCFRFLVKKEIEVENEKEATVKLYDYYQPELEATAEYLIPSTCSAENLPDLHSVPVAFEDTVPDASPTSPLPPSGPGAELSTSSGVQDVASGTSSPTQHRNPEDHVDVGLTSSTAEAETLRNGTEATSTSVEELPLADETKDGARPNIHVLQRFVDISEPLELPGSLEANLPVFVTPPEGFSTESNPSTSSLVNSCPTCSWSFPVNFTDVYCHSEFALRVSVRDTDTGAIKILHDVSVQKSQPQAVREFGRLTYGEHCSCPQISQKGTTVFVFGHPGSLWTASEQRHRLTLTSNVLVVHSPNKLVLPNEIKQSRVKCTNPDTPL